MRKVNTQPEALRLADELDWRHQEVADCPEREAAAELRRLHWAELGVREHRDHMCKEVTRLHSLNSELLEALKLCSAELFAQCDRPRAKSYVAIARAAITKATGGTV